LELEVWNFSEAWSLEFGDLMPLPDLIEIVPLDKPVRAEITVPGSKSITNRALILAALADGEVTLTGALWSEDTQIMVECLQKLGFEIRVENDPAEFCNRTITVKGLGGKIPNAGTIKEPLELFVGNAGTAARFLSAFVCLGKGIYRLHGVLRMHERPQKALFKALRELGYRVETEKGNDRLPVFIQGDGPKAHAKCKVSIEESSQFASALLLCAKVGNWKIEVVGENAEESPYVAMTLKLMDAFPKSGGTFQIEPDASSGSYFWAASKMQNYAFGIREAVTVSHWPTSGWQIDEGFPKYLDLPQVVSRSKDLGDSILTAFILAPFSAEPVKFTDLDRIRVQESDRQDAMFQGLQFSGFAPLSGVAPSANNQDYKSYVSPADNSLIIGSPLKLAANPPQTPIDPRDDHRIAMCFAILGLKVPGIKIKNPACVKKTFPNFFQKLAAPPPHGLGATILDVKSGRKLAVEELFAE
jgi:3-phosphoshikimate 1-carboxyvinyltransferase